MTSIVSAVSAVPEVRNYLVGLQRAEVAAAFRRTYRNVVEGRDIGTTVLPDADLKIFLTADQEARAARRTAQDQQEGRGGEVNATAQSLAARDAADSARKASPLTKADDAIVVDATFMTFDEVVARDRPRAEGAVMPSSATTEPTVVRVPTARGAANGRNVGRILFKTLYRTKIHGAANVPHRGRLIVAANHLGFLDGPLLFMRHRDRFAPRGKVRTL